MPPSRQEPVTQGSCCVNLTCGALSHFSLLQAVVLWVGLRESGDWVFLLWYQLAPSSLWSHKENCYWHLGFSIPTTLPFPLLPIHS